MNRTWAIAFLTLWLLILSGFPDSASAGGRVSGVYENSAIHFLAFNLEWNFGGNGE